jgi:hypothetical protein
VAEDRDLTDTETKNLVRCCDWFVSLHGSEGSGRFLAEATLLGKLAIATAYSGNLDFMNPDFNTWAGWAPPECPKGKQRLAEARSDRLRMHND